ncbi:MAG: hypothetical protein ACKVXR_17805 [Planctomycetota bacterium]
MKIVRRLFLVVLVAALLLIGAGWLFLDSLVEAGIEKGATYATGVETQVEGVDASLFSGRFGLQGLSLANPPGFRSEPFFALKSARAEWENSTILSERIEMDQLVLDGVDVSLERTSSGTNYGVILDHLEKLSPPTQGEEKAPDGAGKRLTIRKIEIRNVHAGLHLSGVPLSSGSAELTIPSVVIENFRSDGETKEIIAQLTRTLLKAILEQVLVEGKNLLPADLLKDLGRNLGSLGGSIEGGVKDALKGIEGALKGAGGIFDKK